MTIITFGGDESWTSPRWAFARLARATSLFVHEAADLEVLEGAVARDALSFTALDSHRACRMARALRQGACWLREDLVGHELEDDSERTLAESLLPLAAQLSRLLDAQAAAERLTATSR